MVEWLIDTLVMTGALMALVLLVRRPVARWFGQGAAYALWLLPMIRLIMPPLVLPQWLALHPVLSIGRAGDAVLPAMPPMETVYAPADPALLAPAMQGAIPADAVVDTGLLAQIDWFPVLIAVWLGGAALFLASRVIGYRQMRRMILADARQVARSGEIRIVESPAVTAPLAFGVFDKLVALPKGFLATASSETSDFAIAHELQHHEGGDLMALMAVQPLFALHWFNPLAWAAWRAMRADQESACDARVMAGCSRAMRARYGQLIASFAAGQRLSLAAPIAGVLAGKKPIIQRLKALGAGDVPEGRVAAARGLFALAIVAVPFTATIACAAADAVDAPSAPETVGNVDAPPAPAVATAAQQVLAPQSDVGQIRTIDPDAPDAPLPPASPDAPIAPVAPAPVAVANAPVPPAPPKAPTPPRWHGAQGPAHVDWHSVNATVARAMERAPRVEQSVSSDGRVQTIRIVSKDDRGVRTAREMKLDSRCPADSGRREVRSANGSNVRICTGEPRMGAQIAYHAISNARASVAANMRLDPQIRADILADFDQELAAAREDMQQEAIDAHNDYEDN